MGTLVRVNRPCPRTSRPHLCALIILARAPVAPVRAIKTPLPTHAIALATEDARAINRNDSLLNLRLQIVSSETQMVLRNPESLTYSTGVATATSIMRFTRPSEAFAG